MLIHEVVHESKTLNCLLYFPCDAKTASLTVVVCYLLDVFVHGPTLSPTAHICQAESFSSAGNSVSGRGRGEALPLSLT